MTAVRRWQADFAPCNRKTGSGSDCRVIRPERLNAPREQGDGRHADEQHQQRYGIIIEPMTTLNLHDAPPKTEIR
jgi:hypothetical protein